MKYLETFFLIVFIFLFESAALFNSSTFAYGRLLQITAAVIIFIILFLLLYILRRNQKFIQLFKTRYTFIVGASIIILFFIQLYIVLSSSISVGWDCGVIITNALSMNLGSAEHYFSIYPNNLFLLFAFRFIIHLFGPNNIWNRLDFINLIAIDVSLILLFYCSKKLFSLKIAYLSFGLSVALFGLFGWILVPYSDILAMPFVMIIFSLYLNLREQKALKHSILYAILIGLSTYIGYLVKPTVVIVLIACFLFEVYKYLKDSSYLAKKISSAMIILGVMFICSLSWKFFIQKQQVLHIDQSQKMPMTHFMMMGLNNVGDGHYGGYNDGDVAYTLSYDSPQKKRMANFKMIKKRLHLYGPIGYSKFLLKKICWITSEGTFYWGGEGGFAEFDLTHRNLVKDVYYPDGAYYTLYKYYNQGLWLVILFFIISPIFWIKSEKTAPNVNLIRLVIVGIILFLLLFEGRSRYLILYLPFFTILAGYGLNMTFNKVTNYSIMKRGKQ